MLKRLYKWFITSVGVLSLVGLIFMVGHTTDVNASWLVRKISGGGAAWAPTDEASLDLWLDDDNIAGLNDTDVIASWDDKSTNALNATQSDADKKPTYQTNEINGNAMVLFDGANDFMEIINSASGGHAFTGYSDAITIAVVVKDDEYAGTILTWYSSDTVIELREESSSHQQVPFSIGFNGNEFHVGVSDDGNDGDEATTSASNLSDGTAYYWMGVIDGDNWYQYVNGSLSANGTLTDADGDRSVADQACNLFLGARSKGDGSSGGEASIGISELMIFESASDALRSNIDTYIDNEFNLIP